MKGWNSPQDLSDFIQEERSYAKEIATIVTGQFPMAL